jgi:hypothetical protein
VFVILFVSFFGGPLLLPLVAVAAVTAYILVFDRREAERRPTEGADHRRAGGRRRAAGEHLSATVDYEFEGRLRIG